jgi:hypothetical protein
LGAVLAHDEPRRRFRFLCADDACRATNVVRVIGVNQTSQSKTSVIAFSLPTSGLIRQARTALSARGVARERILDVLDSSNAEPEQGGRADGFRHPKSSEFVDVFQTRAD